MILKLATQAMKILDLSNERFLGSSYRTFSPSLTQLEPFQLTNSECNHHIIPSSLQLAAFEFTINTFQSVWSLMVNLPIQIPGAVSQICDWYAVQNIGAHCCSWWHNISRKSGTLFTTWLGNSFRLKRAPSSSIDQAQHKRFVPKESRVVRYFTEELACYTAHHAESMHLGLLNRRED